MLGLIRHFVTGPGRRSVTWRVLSLLMDFGGGIVVENGCQRLAEVCGGRLRYLLSRALG
jgi:hypothetical protein